MIERARDFRTHIGNRPLLLFHCASAGELEALKPIAVALDRRRVTIAVSHFSPSARSAAKTGNEFDFADYSPIDTARIVNDYLDALRPTVIAITKHDVWPNFVWLAHDRGIPVYLINGNFHAKSTKRWPLLRRFHAAVYSVFEEIMAVSEEDAQNAREIAGNGIRITNAGDARYDRVLGRVQKQLPLPEGVESFAAGKKVVIAGSTHPDDEELLIPVIPKLKAQIPNLLVVIVPHDPSASARRRIIAACRENGLDICDAEQGFADSKAAVMLINKTGILADLYRIGAVAYVGGGFGKGVHSVLEPMAAGLPVVCGPQIVVSHEARMAKDEDILKIVTGRKQVEHWITTWLNDIPVLQTISMQCREFVLKQSGVSQRIADKLMEHIHE
ncbi:MAG: 3-deoxy-D-manno-octulosonic acid transferase [Calditrichota bacterium]